ncbi:MAG: SHOCT domain-containing protein [Methylobacterium sp.]
MTDDTTARLQALAEKHGVGPEAVRHMLQALESGGGRMAQFDHPEFGGMGQWFSGGMVMVGRMNDHGLKARVTALCEDMSAALPELAPRRSQGSAMSRSSSGSSGDWWPEGLGRASSVGAQNATRYAWFPDSRRLAVETDGRVALYDTGDHVITGASQQQSGTSSFRFSGPHGVISLDDLTPVGQAQSQSQTGEPARAEPISSQPASSEPRRAFASRHDDTRSPVPSTEPARPPAATAHPQTDVLSTLERLAELHRKGILTDAEFSGKKTELLARL